MTDIYESFDYGYDPSVTEDVRFVVPPRPATLPPQANVDPAFLPPVGKQTTPSCFVWSSTYGVATYMAAQASGQSPSSPANQASPTYTYIQVELQQGLASGTCTGGKIASCFDFLNSNGGTPSLAAAPNETGCSAAWNAYGSGGIAPDPAFQVTGIAQISIKGSQGLDSLRTMIVQNVPLAYGTGLYTDFPPYRGTPSPYVGNKQWLYKPGTTQKVGHCMMIIGYDDTMNGGAVLIQNSFGAGWGGSWNGNGGYIWMAYDTFQATAQGGAIYVTSIQAR
ncbi:MAG: hypothetical protein K2Y40_23310 [Reyranella sp.]|nr:hypothetical protein [Reyranella sp.]